MRKKHKTAQSGADGTPSAVDLGQPPVVDAETERLLDAMQKQASTAQIDESGADSSAAPPAATKEVPQRTDGPRMVTNTSGNPHRIGGTMVPLGGAYYLTDQDLTNKRLMQKVEYAIKLKVLSRGAD